VRGGDGVRDAMGLLAEMAKTAPAKPVAPKVGDPDGVSIVGHQIDEMKRTHNPKVAPQQSADVQSIALSMIVRDESRVIARCLASVSVS
jgi:hypothetical protein